MLTIRSSEDLLTYQGTELGVSEWLQITQSVIDNFSEATGDDYWIHTDAIRARESVFGSTIAHGLLVLSLGPALMYKIVEFENFETMLNYGYDSVRFTGPLRVGTRVRMRAQLSSVVSKNGGLLLTVLQTFESEASIKPVCVATSLLFLLDAQLPPSPTEPTSIEATVA
jgi:acyl dehydratase